MAIHPERTCIIGHDDVDPGPVHHLGDKPDTCAAHHQGYAAIDLGAQTRQHRLS